MGNMIYFQDVQVIADSQIIQTPRDMLPLLSRNSIKYIEEFSRSPSFLRCERPATSKHTSFSLSLGLIIQQMSSSRQRRLPDWPSIINASTWTFVIIWSKRRQLRGGEDEALSLSFNSTNWGADFGIQFGTYSTQIIPISIASNVHSCLRQSLS